MILFSLFISPTFATEITDPATCDNGTLSTDTGPTNLRANYESNTLNLKWYDDDGNQLTTNTCTYGGTINLPTPPTKRGYTFKGWKVAIYDFSTLPTNVDGNYAIARVSTSCRRVNNLDEQSIVSINNNSECASLEDKTWKVNFDWGDIYGISLCSSTRLYQIAAGNPDTSGNGYTMWCWCKVTGYKPHDSNVVHNPNTSMSWVFNNTPGDPGGCAALCPRNCGMAVRNNSTTRSAIFGVSGS